MSNRRPMTVSPLWLQGSILTFIIGFAFLSFSALRIYQDSAPVPDRIVDEAGKVLFTRQQILEGQEQFLTYGLMQFGTVYGHGAYLGPDFTADYLHRMALHMNKLYGSDEAAGARTRRELQTNRYDPATGTLTWTVGQASAFEEIHNHFGDMVYGRKVSGEGLKPEMIKNPEETRAITSFIAWTAWTSVCAGPGRPIRTRTTGPPKSWWATRSPATRSCGAALSLVTLLGGSGLVLGVYGRYSRVVGWHETEERQVRFVPPSDVALTPAQRVTAWFFLVVALLFLLQNLVGANRALHGRGRWLLRHRPAAMAPL